MILGRTNKGLAVIELDAKALESRLLALENPDAIQLISVGRIYTDTRNFQNREKEFSQESANRILEAIATGNFRWALFDPITLWLNPKDGRLYVLSGHSRTAALKKASKKYGYEYSYIPAKIIEGISLEEAKEIARNSNTLSTKESEVERAAYYRDLRKNTSSKEVNEKAKKAEGKNWRRIIYYSYLNPKGLLIDSLKNLEASGSENEKAIITIAEWVGDIRRMFPLLTNSHEKELADFLLYGGYGGGKRKGLFTNKSKFLQRVKIAIERNTEFGVFDAQKPLNIKGFVAKNIGEQEHEAITKELRANMEKAQRSLNEKQATFYQAASRGEITRAKARSLIEPYAQAFSTAQKKLADHLALKSQFRKRAQDQTTLFGIPCICHTEAKELGEVEELSGNQDVYDIVNSKILEAIEEGGLFWNQPFKELKKTWIGPELPQNYKSRREYSGINTLLLWAEMATKVGIETPYWMTFNQIKEAGGSVKKGEKASIAVFWKMLVYKDGKLSKMTVAEAQSRQLGGEDIEIRPMLRYYKVFNLSQTEGIDYEEPDVQYDFSMPEKRYIAEAIISGMEEEPVVVNEDLTGAFYTPSRDIINMPLPSMYSAIELYYKTLFHETAHWTGAKHRLNREMGKRFGDSLYAFEELVAELSASYLCAYAGIYLEDNVRQSAAYIDGWKTKIRKSLKDDKKWLVKASSNAQKAVNLIMHERANDYNWLIYEAEALRVEDQIEKI